MDPVGGSWQRGSFRAMLEAEGREVEATVTLALRSGHTALRRPLAFYRLAKALDVEAVAPVAIRPIPLGEIAKLLEGKPEALGMLQARGVIQNDGTIDALIGLALPSEGQLIALDGRAEPAMWRRWSASQVSVPDEDKGLLRAYVEMLVLDYLSGNVGRATVWLDARSGRLVLPDNGTSFPLRTTAHALDRVLRPLREVARFPRALRAALERLDKSAAWDLFNPGDFETWLLPPRTLVELEERRAGVLSLIDARISDQGEANVLSL